MNPSGAASGATKTIALHLSESDHEILEKFRGDLTADAFISALLRMIDSGVVRNTPDWVKGADEN
jgi:hypothetical protein